MADTIDDQLIQEALKRTNTLNALIEALKIVEYDISTGLPTGKKFKMRKYTDGTTAWEETT